MAALSGRAYEQSATIAESAQPFTRSHLSPTLAEKSCSACLWSVREERAGTETCRQFYSVPSLQQKDNLPFPRRRLGRTAWATGRSRPDPVRVVQLRRHYNGADHHLEVSGRWPSADNRYQSHHQRIDDADRHVNLLHRR